MAVHEALAELEKEDPLKAQIVNLRYFTGMTVPETSSVYQLAAPQVTATTSGLFA
jgi:hypothetical protein